MSLKKELRNYYRQISKGLRGYDNRRAVLDNLKYRIDNCIKRLPDVGIDYIIANFGKPEEIVEKNKNGEPADFYILVKKMRPIEWVIVALGLCVLAWCIYSALGGTIDSLPTFSACPSPTDTVIIRVFK